MMDWTCPKCVGVGEIEMLPGEAGTLICVRCIICGFRTRGTINGVSEYDEARGRYDPVKKKQTHPRMTEGRDDT